MPPEIAAVAVKKVSHLAPGEFRFVTKALSIEPGGEGGKRRFKMVASSTITDEGDDEIKMSALEDLRMAFAGGLNIFTDHVHTVDNVFGRSDEATIMASGGKDPKTGAPVYDLHVAGVVNEPNPRMVQLADSIDGGYVTFGASIGAKLVDAKRNKAGGFDIFHLAGKEASLVGIPMNQRSWTYKAAKAAKALEAASQIDEDDEDEEAPKSETAKADPLSNAARVRAALSRLADGDQTQRASVIAAARQMGIGDHKGLNDDDLVTWAAIEYPAIEITKDDEDCEVFIVKTAPEAELTPEPEADGQESEPETPETPETASEADEAETDPPDTEKALTFDATDVVTLAKKARDLAQMVIDRDEQIVVLKGERDQLASENVEAKALIERVMALPLRRKAVGDAADFSKRLPGFLAPEVKAFLTKTAGERT